MTKDSDLFGKKIEFSTVLRRGYDPKFSPRDGGSGKSWRIVKIPETSGIIIGIRSLQNGAVRWIDDGPAYFVPREYFQCLLVAMDMRKNPVYIPLSELKNKGILNERTR